LGEWIVDKALQHRRWKRSFKLCDVDFALAGE